jgi:3-methyladenine DNA glycosylase AlkD
MATTKKLRAIAADFREFCAANADEERARRYDRYFTEGYDAWGIPKEVWEEKKDELIERYSSTLSLDDVLELGDLLMESGKYEEASFPILLAQAYVDVFTPEAFQGAGRWLENGILNWGHTDVLCGFVLSAVIERKIVKIQDMAEWRTSESKWKRRAVPVAMVDLAKKARSVRAMLRFVEPMMMDDDRFVQQGIGWFLRESWKRQPEPVEALLLKHKDTAPRKIYQYATEKMAKEERVKYRRARKGTRKKA